MSGKRFILLSFLLIALMALSRPVHADVAPEPEIAIGGLEPQFKTTEVAMLYERVEMELEMFQPVDLPELTQNRVRVNAYFVMKNLGQVDESMKAVFPSQNTAICRGITSGDTFTYYDIVPDSFTVSVDGTNVPIDTLDAPYVNCDEFPWQAFDVTFPVNREVLIKVSYVMETQGVDDAQNIDYILETGAGWKGNIGRGYVILKFPYTVTPENILDDTSEGYQTLYNEIFWAFQDLEPTPENNIHISIVSPNVWLEIQRLRDQIRKEPGSPDLWSALLDRYAGIAYSNKGQWIRDLHYADLISLTYENAIRANPNNADLPANYAAHKLFHWSPYGEPITEEQAAQIVPLLNRALALDAENDMGNIVLSQLEVAAPFITFTPPPTVPPTPTSRFTSTPLATSTPTVTPIPSQRPTSTKELKSTSTPRATATPTAVTATGTVAPTITASDEKETGNQSPLSIAIIGMVATFIAGIVIGILWSRFTKR